VRAVAFLSCLIYQSYPIALFSLMAEKIFKTLERAKVLRNALNAGNQGMIKEAQDVQSI
jgi:hypothetical protein